MRMLMSWIHCHFALIVIVMLELVVSWMTTLLVLLLLPCCDVCTCGVVLLCN